jgi:hypothetical protein
MKTKVEGGTMRMQFLEEEKGCSILSCSVATWESKPTDAVMQFTDVVWGGGLGEEGNKKPVTARIPPTEITPRNRVAAVHEPRQDHRDPRRRVAASNMLGKRKANGNKLSGAW